MNDDNYIINEDFSKYDENYYVVFKTPNGEIKRVEGLKKIELEDVDDNNVQLNITYSGGTLKYVYTWENIVLLDTFDIGFD